MKGIILAAGKGTRLYPMSIPITKILLPIYDKPMIYYPLSTLMLAGIKDILIVSNEESLDTFKKLLGDGSQFGIKIQYDIQYSQRGIADVFLIAEEFINRENVALILGDNIFYSETIGNKLKNAVKDNKGATIFGYSVKDPERFGVMEIDKKMDVVSLEEKPNKPKSNYAVTGLYFYDSNVCDYAKQLKPSDRGELEITDLNKIYLEHKNLHAIIMNSDMIWHDAGTFDSMIEASVYVQKMEKEKGKKISCPEEIALSEKNITPKELFNWISKFKENDYFRYVRCLTNQQP